MVRCVNIDWLEVYVLEEPELWPMDAHFFRNRGWEVNEREYGTRTYAEMFTLYDREGMPFIEVRRNPVGVLKNGKENYSFEAYGAKLRFVNRYCYYDRAAELMQQFITRERYQFSRISKIDLCVDFIKFDSGDLPAKFLQRYVAGKYSKVNQSNVTAYGKDTWGGRGWNSVSWGSKKSPIFTRLYCKSMELDEQHDKPYIRQAWAAAGLVVNPITCEAIDENGETYKPMIWRLEFSIASSVKKWVTVEDQVTPGLKKRSFKNTLDVYFSRMEILQMIASLCKHYFSFRYYEEGVSKYKCKEKVLFHFDEVKEFYKIDKVATDKERSSLIKKLKRLLEMFNITHHDTEANHAAEILLSDLERLEAKEMACNPYDRDEVSQLLALIINLRINNTELTYEEAKKKAEDFVEVQRYIWDNLDEEIEE